MFFLVCSAAFFYLQRSSFLFAAFLFFICSVPFFYICSGSLFCLQRFFFVCSVSFLFAAFLFCLQRFSFVCSVSFLFAAFLFYLQRFFFVCSVSFMFAACPLWATVNNDENLQYRSTENQNKGKNKNRPRTSFALTHLTVQMSRQMFRDRSSAWRQLFKGRIALSNRFICCSADEKYIGKSEMASAGLEIPTFFNHTYFCTSASVEIWNTVTK